MKYAFSPIATVISSYQKASNRKRGAQPPAVSLRGVISTESVPLLIHTVPS